MTEDRIEVAIHAWAAEKLGISVESITSVEFDTIYGGYCETCEYTTFGAVVRTPTRRYEIEEYDATQVIRDINAKVLKDD